MFLIFAATCLAARRSPVEPTEALSLFLADGPLAAGRSLRAAHSAGNEMYKNETTVTLMISCGQRCEQQAAHQLPNGNDNWMKIIQRPKINTRKRMAGRAEERQEGKERDGKGKTE